MFFVRACGFTFKLKLTGTHLLGRLPETGHQCDTQLGDAFALLTFPNPMFPRRGLGQRTHTNLYDS